MILASTSFSLCLCLFFSENGSEDESYERSAIEHLIQNGHREIHSPGLDPHSKALGVFEEKHSDKAHNGAHNAADANRNGICDNLRPVCRTNHFKSKHLRDFSNNEELKHECNGSHDRKFVQSKQKCLIGHSMHCNGNIVNDHSIHHDGRHYDGKYCVLKFVFRHKKILPCDNELLCVVRYHPGRSVRFQSNHIMYCCFSIAQIFFLCNSRFCIFLRTKRARVQ